MYIKPTNFASETDDFIQFMGYDPTAVIVAFKPTGPSEYLLLHAHSLVDVAMCPIKTPITVRNLILNHLDLFGRPKRYFFELASHFADEPMQKERLLEFSSKEGQEDMFVFTHRAKRNYVDVLHEFPDVKPPLDYLLDMIPKLQARPFSISSAQIANPNRMSVSMVVVKYKSIIARLKLGVCSVWLSQLDLGAKIPIYVRRGTIALAPQDKPLIMVGPGTGCAIFRAFLQHRRVLKERGETIAPSLFYFGCRGPEDELYVDEWKELEKSGVLTQYSVAYSRTQSSKCYVQHKLKEDSALIYKWMMEDGAAFYLSG